MKSKSDLQILGVQFMWLFHFLKMPFLHLHYESCLFVISKSVFLDDSTVRNIDNGIASTFLSSIFWSLVDQLHIFSSSFLLKIPLNIGTFKGSKHKISLEVSLFLLSTPTRYLN